MNFERAISQLNETLGVIAGIERDQSRTRAIAADAMAGHERRMRHIDQKLAKITQRLERLRDSGK